MSGTNEVVTMRAIRVARVLIAALAVVVLVAGPPALLWAFRGSVLPNELPTWDQVWEMLSGPDTGKVFLGVLVLGGAVAWAQLVAGFAVEIAALARGRALPRIRGIRWAQTVAGMLLAIVFGASAATAVVPAAAASAQHVVASAPPVAGGAPAAHVHLSENGPTAVSERALQPKPGQRTYVVRPSDSLIRIAAEQLGDENRYREIFEANRGVRQADGHALTDVALLRPGWVLTLPGEAEPQVAGEVRVRSGDTLSGIARDHLGDAGRYQEIFDINVGGPQSGGMPLADPDVIRPGMVLRLPQPATADQAETPSERPEPPEITEGNKTESSVPPTSSPTTGEAAPQPSPTHDESPATDDMSGGAGHDADTESENDGVLLSIGSIGALTASGVLAILGARRWHTRRRRRPGHRMPHLHPTDLETTLRIAEEPATVHLLDRGLRTLAAKIRDKDQSLPAIRSAVVMANGGLLLQPVDIDEPAPTPFASIRDAESHTWALQRDAVLLDDDAAAEVPAPYPALVTLGTDDAGNLVLINLEEIGAIVVSGAAEDVESILIGMAVDLAASTWADHVVATLVGVGQTIAAHLPDRLRFAETVDEVLDAFARRAQDVTDGFADAGIDSVNAARGRDVAEDAWTPSIILSAQPLTEQQRDRLVALIDQGGPANGLAAVITGGDPDQAPAGAWHLDAGDDPATVAGLDMSLRLQRLTKAQQQQLVSALASADDTTQVPAEDYSQVPAEPETIPDPLLEAEPDAPSTVAELDHVLDAATTSHTDDVGSFDEAGQLPVNEPEIKLLGPVRLVGVDPAQVEAKKLNRLTELAAYLCLHPNTNGAELSRQLGTDDRPWSAATRQGYVSRLRTWLGRDSAGENYVPLVEPGRGYRLAETVDCDWHRFTALARQGLHAGPDGVERLQAALTLVSGMPFSGVPIGRYAWASFLKQEMIDTVVDIAHAAATHLLADGNLRAARIAIARGLQAEPVSELLYRDLIRIEYRGQNLAGVRAAADKLNSLAIALDIDLEPETSELIHQALDPRYRAAATTRAK